MENQTNLSLIDKFAKFLFLTYVFSIFVFSTYSDTNTISKLIFVAYSGICFLVFFKLRKIRLDAYFWYFSVFIAFVLLSSLWAVYPTLAITKGITLIQILILCVFSYSLFYSVDDADFIAKSIYISGLCMCLYILFVYGVNNFLAMLDEGERLGGEVGQVNSIGSYATITVVIGLYYALMQKKPINYVFILLPLFIAFSTGSKKTLISIVFGALALFFFKFKAEITLKNIIKTVIIVAVLAVAFNFILKLDIFSTLNVRMEGLKNLLTGKGEADSSTLKRQMMINAGLDQFKKTPLLGIGIGSSGYINQKILGINAYLHNNYVEILACGGIVGFVCYYAMYCYLLINLIKLALKNNITAVLPFVIIIILLLNQIGVVNYYSKTTYIYLMYCFLIVKTEKDKLSERIAENENS